MFAYIYLFATYTLPVKSLGQEFFFICILLFIKIMKVKVNNI